MKTVHVSKAVGMILGHDITKVEPEKFKGVAFKKGHIIEQQDIPVLLSMGKDHIYVMRIGDSEIHEDNAAELLAKVSTGDNIVLDPPSEGKVGIKASISGLLQIDVKSLQKINSLRGIAISTLHTETIVQKGQLVASAKIIPLILPSATIDQVKQLSEGKKIIRVTPLPTKKVGLVVTGNEVFYGRIEDRFEGIIRKKISEIGSELTHAILVPDDINQISSAIEKLVSQNDIVIVTGGMSVDPDDVTPQAVHKAGARTVVYGTPVLPGAMFLVAYLKNKPILGLPACGMFSKITVLDILLKKAIIGEKITRRNIASLGHGGLCQTCIAGCRYPNCSFCK